MSSFNARWSDFFVTIAIVLAIMNLYQSLQYTQQYTPPTSTTNIRETEADSSQPVVTKENPPELTPAPVVKDDNDHANITVAVTTTAVASAPAAETAGQEKDSPGKVIIKKSDAAIQGKAEIFQNLNIRYYMYNHPNITLSNTRFPKKERINWVRYSHEGSNDAQMLAALEQSPLRALRSEDAELYIPPIPMAKILTCRDTSQFHPLLAFDTLVNHKLFCQHQGNKHLSRNEKIDHMIPMQKWHPLIYNVTPVLSCDPNAVHNAVLIFRGLRYCLDTDAVSGIELQLAYLKKFQNSSNLVFYQSRPETSFNTSTMFRHAPITNINPTTLPKGSTSGPVG